MNYRASLPNWLTYFRVAVIPLIMVTYHLPGALGMHVSTALFFLACATDWLDGYLARRWEVQSNIGRFLDPIADKLLVATCLILLVSDGRAYALPIIVIIFRELLVSGLREFLADKNIVVHVTALAKYKTAMQMFAVGGLLWSTAAPWWIFADTVGTILLWAAAALTLITGWQYVRHGWEHLSQTET